MKRVFEMGYLRILRAANNSDYVESEFGAARCLSDVMAGRSHQVPAFVVAHPILRRTQRRHVAGLHLDKNNLVSAPYYQIDLPTSAPVIAGFYCVPL